MDFVVNKVVMKGLASRVVLRAGQAVWSGEYSCTEVDLRALGSRKKRGQESPQASLFWR